MCTVDERARRMTAPSLFIALVSLFVVPSRALADCVVQDASGLTRAVLLGEGRATITMVLRGEKPALSELQLRRVTGLAAVVVGRLEQSTATFSGVPDGTWQIALPSAQIASVSIERPEGNLPPLQSPSSSPQNGG